MRTLVTVVVPAYNAEATLAETLDSIARQTYPNIEIIVVDDGSKDCTRAIAEDFAAKHPNTRVISTPNGGVAAARNTGIRAAKGNYIAPIDADDLWHPDKTALQCAILDADPEVTLVYANRRHIDPRGMVLNSMPPATLEGYAYVRHAAFNAVGNGSAIMFRRSDAERVGGYDPRLRDWGGQGCEDYLLQVQLAGLGKMRVAPGYLVGYRQLDDAMSRDSLQMLRSRVLALRVLAQDRELLPDVIRSIQSVFELRLSASLFARNQHQEAIANLASAVRGVSPSLIFELKDRIRHRVHRLRQAEKQETCPAPARRHFYDYAADEDGDNCYPPMVMRVLRRYLPYDRQLEPVIRVRCQALREEAARGALQGS